MNNITLKGKTKVENMEFNHIEGGFGEQERAMLVKDIAEIHQKGIREINQAINMNRNRFKDNVDIIDLKNHSFAINLIDSGIYTQNSINASKNIYLLSERGYSKLLKILEDDFAWEQYEKLVDGYFNMRQAIKGNSIDIAKMLNQQVNLILGEVDGLNDRVENLENNMTVDFGQQRRLQNKAKSKAVTTLGGIDSPAYKNSSIRGKVFSSIWRDYKDYFMVSSYRDTSRVDFEKGMAYLDNWQVQGRLLREIEDCNKQISIEEAI